MTHRNIKDISIIDVNVDIDLQKMDEIKTVISSLIDNGKCKVILNLKETKHINYLSIDILLERLIRLRQLDGDLRLVIASDYLVNIFKVVGADNQFRSYNSVDNAVESFEQEVYY